MLKEYKWRGNVRELENEIERMLILGQDEETLGPELLSSRIRDAVKGGDGVPPPALNGNDNSFSVNGMTLKKAIEQLERRMIAAALERLGGNKSGAAKELGISRSSLIAKVQEYNLESGKGE